MTNLPTQRACAQPNTRPTLATSPSAPADGFVPQTPRHAGRKGAYLPRSRPYSSTRTRTTAMTAAPNTVTRTGGITNLPTQRACAQPNTRPTLATSPSTPADGFVLSCLTGNVGTQHGQTPTTNTASPIASSGDRSYSKNTFHTVVSRGTSLRKGHSYNSTSPHPAQALFFAVAKKKSPPTREAIARIGGARVSGRALGGGAGGCALGGNGRSRRRWVGVC